MQTLIIDGELPDLNTYIRIERGNKFAAASAKKEATELVAWYAKKLQPIEGKTNVRFTWYCKNKRKDPDNIAFAAKFILDGFVIAGILKDDGWDEIGKIEHLFAVDSKDPRIEVTLWQ